MFNHYIAEYIDIANSSTECISLSHPKNSFASSVYHIDMQSTSSHLTSYSYLVLVYACVMHIYPFYSYAMVQIKLQRLVAM